VLRKIVATLAADGVTLAIASVTGAAANASAAAPAYTTACPAEITHPNISLHTDPQYQGYSLVQSCGAIEADWNIVAADSYDHGGVYWPGGLSTDYYADSFDVGGHLGKYYLYPAGAYDSNYNDVPQATETFYIKLSSHAYIRGYRSGNWVYAHAYVSRYNPNANYGSGGYTPSAGRYVAFWDWHSGAWHNPGHKYTGSNGWTGYLKIWAPTQRSFYVNARQTSTRWNARSGYIYR